MHPLCCNFSPAASCTHFDGDNEISHSCALNWFPHMTSCWITLSLTEHWNSQSDICQKETGVKVEREDVQLRNRAGFLIFYTLAAGLDRITLLGQALCWPSGRVGLGEQQRRRLRQASRCFTDSRMCRGAHRHFWWTTVKESKPGRSRRSGHRDLITGSRCTCPLCQMKAGLFLIPNMCFGVLYKQFEKKKSPKTENILKFYTVPIHLMHITLLSSVVFRAYLT